MGMQLALFLCAHFLENIMDAPTSLEKTASSGKSLIKSIKEADRQRADFPGEHLIVFGTGLFLLWAATRSRSTLGKLVIGAAASAVIGRAASGTGGIARIAGVLQGGRR